VCSEVEYVFSELRVRLSKKGVILNWIQNLQSKITLGDTGSGSGMTKVRFTAHFTPFLDSLVLPESQSVGYACFCFEVSIRTLTGPSLRYCAVKKERFKELSHS